MRLFIALDLKELKSEFQKIQHKLPKDIAKFKIVPTFHLTLKFLGDVNEDKIEEIKQALSTIRFHPFRLTSDNLGVFPSNAYIKVIWIGLKENIQLQNLQKQIEKTLEKFHFRKDFEFLAHVTLARVKFISSKEKFIKKLNKIKVLQKEATIKEFKLIRSTLTKKGPIYKDLEIFKAK